ncbi:cell wall protein/ swmB family [Synechococcus sp. WH 8101]|uniref:VCBS domain-containing protein n=1 Tax=Synechococcus sp. WH 8101 TaxID=59932 RepID=UPI00164AF013|nr:VCBS domain-containing protein [Synechococcus sp. WH 8101]QNI44622.1 cell wall protein/ swmB family [Synechococcus sp. WH 8101]
MDPLNEAQGAQGGGETASSAAAEAHGSTASSEAQGETGSHAPSDIATPKNSSGQTLKGRIKRLLGLENLHHGSGETYEAVEEPSKSQSARQTSIAGESLVPLHGDATMPTRTGNNDSVLENSTPPPEPEQSGNTRQNLVAATFDDERETSEQIAADHESDVRPVTDSTPEAHQLTSPNQEHVTDHASAIKQDHSDGVAPTNSGSSQPISDADESASLKEDSSKAGQLLTGTSSPDGPVSIQDFSIDGLPGTFTPGQTVNIPGVGSFSLDAQGAYSFTPVQNWNGAVPPIHYTVTDGSSTDQSTLSLNVNPVDDPFSDADECASLKEDSSIAGQLLTGTSSPDGPVSIQDFSIDGLPGTFTPGQTVNIPGIGSFSLDAQGAYSFTPDQNWNGAVPPIHYTVTDGSSTDQSTLSLNVASINDKPVFSSTLVYPAIEGGAIRSGQLTVTDPDDPQASLIISAISPHNLPAGFVINPDGSWSFDPSNSAYNHLQEGKNQDILVNLQVTDPHGSSSQQQLTIHLTGTNDGPTLQSITDAKAKEDGPQVQGQLTATDPDTGDQLAFSLASGQSLPAGFVINPDGSWSFDPSNSAYNHLQEGKNQDILVNLQVTDPHGSSSQQQLTIHLTGTNDGPTLQSITDAKAKEDGPQVQGQLTATDPDTGDQLAFSLASGQSLPAGFVINPDGSWSFDPSNSAYNHLQEGKNQDILVNLQVTDPHGSSSQQQLTIHLTGTNDGPTLQSITDAKAKEDGPQVQGQLTATDPDTGDQLAFSLASGQSLPAGFVINPDGSWSFDPSNSAYNHLQEGKNQDILVNLQVTDPHGSSSQQQLTIHLTGTNDGPTLQSITDAKAKEDGPQVQGQLTATDPDTGDQLAFSLASGQSLPAGFVINPDGSWSFDPSNSAYNHLQEGKNQDILVNLQVTDPHGSSSQQQLTIHLTGTNDGPTLQSITDAKAKEDGPQVQGQLTATDPDTGDQLAFSLASGQSLPAGFVINPDGSWSFDPSNSAYNHLQEGKNQDILVNLQVTDPHGSSSQQQLTIHLTGTNDGPTLQSITDAKAKEDGPQVQGQLTATDPDTGDQLAFSLASGQSLPAGFVINPDGSWSFDPSNSAYNHLQEGKNQDILVNLQVTDPHGSSSQQQLTIHLTGTNDGPTLQSITDAKAKEDGPQVQGQLTATDPDTGDQLAFSLASGQSLPAGFVINPDGSWSFDPSNSAYNHLQEGKNQDILVNLQVTDPHGSSSQQQLTIHLTGTNDGPTLQSITDAKAKEDGPQVQGQLTATDPDTGDQLAFSLASGQSLPAGFVINPDGSWSFDPSNSAYNHLQEGKNQDILVNLQVTDPHGSSSQQQLTIHLTGTNDGPTLQSITDAKAKEDGPQVQGQLTATDPDTGDQLAFSLASGQSLPAGFVINPDGSWSFDPSNSAYNHLQEGKNQDILVNLQVTDPHGSSSQQQLTIHLTGTNDGPTLQSITDAKAKEDGPQVQGQLTATDPDTGDQLAFSLASGQSLPAGFVINPDGSWSFDPSNSAYNHLQEGKNQDILVNLQVTDPHGSSSQQQLTIHLTGTNDGPTLQSITDAKAKEDGPQVQGQLTATDPDTGDQLAFSLASGQSLPAGFVINPDGSWSFDPSNSAYNHLQEGKNQDILVNLQVTDPHGSSSQQQLTIHLTGTNDGPTLNAITRGVIKELEGQGQENQEQTSGLSGNLQGQDIDDNEQSALVYGIQGSQSGSYDHNGAHFDLMKTGSYGTAYLNSKTGAYEYVPEHAKVESLHHGEHQHDNFRMTVTDGHRHSVTHHDWLINLNGGADKPVFTDGPQQTAIEDLSRSVSGKLNVVDADKNESLFVDETIQGNHGTLVIRPDGTWTYQLKSGSSDPQVNALNPTDKLAEQITVHSKDGTSHQFTVLIQGSNDAPTLHVSPAIQTVSEDSNNGLSGHIQGQDVDHQAVLHYELVDQNGHPCAAPVGFHFNSQTGDWSFVPTDSTYQSLNHGEHKDLNIYVMAVDERQATSPIQHLSLRVTGENDIPTAQNRDLQAVNEDQRVTISETELLKQLGITDVDQRTRLHITDLTSSTTGCRITPLGNGQYQIHLPRNWNSDEHQGNGIALALNVDDGTKTTPFQASMHVNAVNDRPTASSFSFNAIYEDKSLKFTENDLLSNSRAHDVDQPDLGHLSIVPGSVMLTDPALGSLGFDQATQAWIFQPAANWNSQDHAGQKVQIQFKVQDPSGETVTKTASVEVKSVQDVATITDKAKDHTVTEVNQGTASSCSGQLQVSDVDKGEDHFRGQSTILSANHYGIAHIDGTGKWVYELDSANPAVNQLAAGQQLTDTFEVHSADGTTHTVTIQIRGTDDLPVVDPIADLITNEDGGPQSGHFLATDVDLGENPTFSLDPNNPPIPGLTVQPDGSWSFDPSQYGYLDTGETVDQKVILLVSDGNHNPVKVEYHIQVEGRNDAPTVQTVTKPLVIGQEDGGSHDPNTWIHGSGTGSGSLHFSNQDLLSHIQAQDPDTADQSNLHVIDAKLNWPGHTAADLQHAGHLIQDGKGNYEFVPAHNFSGTIQIQFLVTDGKEKVASTVNLQVDPVNDAPHAINHWLGSTGKGGFDFTAKDLIAGSNDVDSPNSLIALVGMPTVPTNQGSIKDLGNGHYHFEPNPNYQTIGHINIHYQLTDGQDAGNTAIASFHFDPSLPSGLSPAALIQDLQHQDAYEDLDPSQINPNLPASGEGSGQLQALDANTHQMIGFKAGTTTIPNVGDFKIDSNGHWTFTPDYAKLQHLNAGSSEHHWITLETTDGTRFQQKLTIHGLDDPGQLQLGAVKNVTEDDPDATHRQCSGQVILQDVDDGQHSFNGENGLMGQYGVLKLQPDGHYQYELFTHNQKLDALDQGQVVQETFTLHERDGSVIQQKLVINVTGTNDAPVITGVSSATVDMSQSHPLANGNVNAFDPDAQDQLSYALGALDPSLFPHGLAGFQIDQTGQWSFDPSQCQLPPLPPGQSQTLQIPIVVSDQHGGSTTGHIQIQLTGNTQNHPPTVSVTQVNLIPQNLFTEDKDVVLNVTDLLNRAGATDLDNDKLGIVELKLNNTNLGHFTDDGKGHITFHPNANVNTDGGTFSFSYRVTDGQEKSDLVTVTARLDAVNDNPIINAQTGGLGETKEEINKTFTASDLLKMCSDVDIATNHDQLSVVGTPTVDPTEGSITEQPPNSGTYLFIPAANFNGQAHIKFTVSDSQGAQVSGSTFIKVTAAPDKAVITLDRPTNPHVTEDDGSTPSLQGHLNIHDDDGASEEHFQASNNIQGKYGYLTLTRDGDWTYVLQKNGQSTVQGLAQNEQLTETITVKSKDGTGYDLHIQILGSNDQANIIGAASATLDTQTRLQTSGTVSVQDRDKSEAGHTQTEAGSSAKGYGMFSVDGDGNWSYQLIPGDPRIAALPDGKTVTDSFVLHSVDGSAQRTITVTIVGQNDGPVIDQAHISGFPVLPGHEDQTRIITSQELLAGITDPDGDSLSITSISVDPSQAGSISADPQHPGQYLFKPAADFNGSVQFHYTVEDGHGGSVQQTASMLVTPDNDAPVFSSGSNAFAGSVDEDGTASTLTTQGLVTATDVDQDTLSFNLVNGHDLGGGISELVLAEGIFHLNRNTGEWSFELNNANPKVSTLKDGDLLPISAMIEVSDGQAKSQPHALNVTVHGHTDGPSVGAQPPAVIVGEQGSGYQSSSVQNLNLQAGDLPITDLALALPAQFGNQPIAGIPHWRVDQGTGDLIGSFDENGTSVDAVRLHLMPHGAIQAHSSGVVQVQINLLHDLNHQGNLDLQGFEVQAGDGQGHQVATTFGFNVADGTASITGVPLFAGQANPAPGMHQGAFEVDGADVMGGSLLLSIDGHAQHNAFIGTDTNGDGLLDQFQESTPWGTLEASIDPQTGKGSWSFQEGPAYDPQHPPQIQLGFEDHDGSQGGFIPLDVTGVNLTSSALSTGNPAPPPAPPVPGSVLHDEPVSGDDLYAAVMAFQSGAIGDPDQGIEPLHGANPDHSSSGDPQEVPVVEAVDVFLDPQENGNSHANGNSHGPSTASDHHDPLDMEGKDHDGQGDAPLSPPSAEDGSAGDSLIPTPEHHDPVLDHSLLGS